MVTKKKGQMSYIRGYKYRHYQACLFFPVFSRQPYHSPSLTVHVQNTLTSDTMTAHGDMNNPNYIHRLTLG